MKKNNLSNAPSKTNQKSSSSQKLIKDTDSKIDTIETVKSTEINENRSFLDYYANETNGDR